MMCKAKPHPCRRGSILLLTLLTTAILATLALSFAATMKASIQVTRDHTASLHSDLAAQSGLEFSQHQLLLDPEWNGTPEGPLQFGEEGQFSVIREVGVMSRTAPTEVLLTIEGAESYALTRLQAQVLVTPGDPLLDKALSVLGGASGSNLAIDGDYLLIDAAGHLWDFRDDLIPSLEKDDRMSFDNNSRGSNKELFFAAADFAKINTKLAKAKSKGKTTKVQKIIDKYGSALDAWILQGGGTSHLRGRDLVLEGVWLPSTDTIPPVLTLTRVDAPGDLHNYSPTRYGWAAGQVMEQDPVHAPGWKLGSYLNPAPDLVIYDHVTDLRDVILEETAVFLLDPGQTLYLENVQLRGGMVVYAEADYDSAGPPRNYLTLGGSCVIGGGNGGRAGIGILAPGCRFSTVGAQRQEVTGFSVLHSMETVQRLIHQGVLIILNSAVGVIDSSFSYDRSVAIDPPLGLAFFGELPGIDILLLQEAYDDTLSP